jgi:hypothetical protein
MRHCDPESFASIGSRADSNRIAVGETDIGFCRTDSELWLVAALRRAARERGGPLPSVGVADALLDEPPKADAASNVPQLRAWRPQVALGHKEPDRLSPRVNS